MKNSIKIICGHYGCGKTNLILNLATEESKLSNDVVLVDLDIVNPYFRSSDYEEILIENGIKLISPKSAGTTLDSPALSAEIFSCFAGENKKIFIDLGGDDVGARALSRFRQYIDDYEMIYVINKSRLQSQNEDFALELLREIESSCKLKATAIVNNTHLGVETTQSILIDSIEYANQFSKISGLPLLYSVAPDFMPTEGFKTIKRYVTFPWESM